MTLENGAGLKMYLPLGMVIFQPAMLVFRGGISQISRIPEWTNDYFRSQFCYFFCCHCTPAIRDIRLYPVGLSWLCKGELLLLDSLGRFVSKEYPQRVACHEAGHFLVAYLLGVLPKAGGCFLQNEEFPSSFRGPPVWGVHLKGSERILLPPT